MDGIYVHTQSNTVDLEIVNSIIRNTIQDLNDKTLDPAEYKRRREIKVYILILIILIIQYHLIIYNNHSLLENKSANNKIKKIIFFV